jgi:thioredoxin reductase (NADPH)
MAKPVIVVVDDEDDSLATLARELESRYGAHYLVVACASPGQALARLAELRAGGASVPLVLADQWMPELTGAELLAQVRDPYPTARRGLLISRGDQSAMAGIANAAALGQIEFHLPKPAWEPDEQFHLAVTESLEEWWREQGGRFEAVTLIGQDPSARVHEIRDLLTRNNIPFGFLPSDSEEGRAALERLGVAGVTGPVVALYTGAVLLDPANAEVAEALGTPVRPAGLTYDVVIVGAGPAGLAAAVYGHHPGPLALPRRQHVRLPDPRDQECAQHRCPLPHRAGGRRRCRAPRVPAAAGQGLGCTVKRVASAVGEGSTAIRLIHEYLALGRE